MDEQYQAFGISKQNSNHSIYQQLIKICESSEYHPAQDK